MSGRAQCPLPPPNLPGSFENSVNRIVFVMKESRSFDAYFGKLNDYRSTAFLIGRDTDDLESTFTHLADDGTPVSNSYLDTAQPDMTEFFDFINAPNTFASPADQPTRSSVRTDAELPDLEIFFAHVRKMLKGRGAPPARLAPWRCTIP